MGWKKLQPFLSGSAVIKLFVWMNPRDHQAFAEHFIDDFMVLKFFPFHFGGPFLPFNHDTDSLRNFLYGVVAMAAGAEIENR